jgi:LPS-assembly lipoprotein
LRVLGTLAASLLLAGCFHPLYATVGGDGTTIAEELRTIAVDPIPDRVGHYLGNELIFALNGTGQQVPPKYHLAVTTSEEVQTALIDTLQQRATSAMVVLHAKYQLLPVGSSEPVTSGEVLEPASYDRSEQRYANVRAARDAEIRAAQVLADQIKTRIAAFLATSR